MNQFEFMRNLPVGLYLPLDSFIHRMDPRARLTAMTILLLALTFTKGLAGLLIGLFFILCVMAIARIQLRYALRGLRAPLPFILFLAFFQIIWNGGIDTGPVLLSWEGITLTVTDITNGAALFVRFIGLVLGLSLLSYTTSTNQMSKGLHGMLWPISLFHIQVDDFVMMVQITLRFIPLLAQTSERIAKAQAARGANWDNDQGNIFMRVRQIIPLIVPLFITSLNRAGNLALAMDARGYGSGIRTSQTELRMQPIDWVGLVAAGMVAGMILMF